MSISFNPVADSGIPAGAFGTRWSAIASICRRPASLHLGLAFRLPISRARRQMRGDRIKCLGLRTYRTSCINATDSICRRARMESQSVVKLGQWARVDDKSNRSRSACGNATCGIDSEGRWQSWQPCCQIAVRPSSAWTILRKPLRSRRHRHRGVSRRAGNHTISRESTCR